MNNNLPAAPERHKIPPAESMRQRSAQQPRQVPRQNQGQINRRNTAGQSPAVRRTKPVVSRNVKRTAVSRPNGQPVRQMPTQAQRPAGQQQRRVPTDGRPAVNNPAANRPAVNLPATNRPVRSMPSENRAAVNRQVQKAHAVKKNDGPKNKIPKKPFILLALFAILATPVVLFIFFMVDENLLIKKTVTVEAGSTASFDMFLKGEPKYPQYLSTNLDFSTIDYNAPQTVYFVITLYGIDHNCELVVADTIPPQGEAIPQELYSVDPLPEASKCITNINDVTPVTVSWAEQPDISAGGEFAAPAKLTDAVGNETIVLVPLSVTRDSAAPEIAGTRDISIIQGETIAYRTGITVTDNIDKNPKLEIDTSGVNLSKAGAYKATYKAYDFTGNKTEVTINVTIKPKPKDYVDPKTVYAQAKEVLDKIVTPEMTDMEKALQIVWWCRYNIKFTTRIKPKSWTEAAHNAFKERRGNCLSTASCVRAMLDVAGIENMFVTRWPYKIAKHYWNYVKIDGQWYHCDATWRQNYESYFFMYTTKELLAFWHDGWNGFEFDQKKYPESATASVQKKIDYKNHKIKS